MKQLNFIGMKFAYTTCAVHKQADRTAHSKLSGEKRNTCGKHNADNALNKIKHMELTFVYGSAAITQ